jgi:hypothetical protein
MEHFDNVARTAALKALSDISRIHAIVDVQRIVMARVLSAASAATRQEISDVLAAQTLALRQKDPTDAYLEAFLEETHRYRLDRPSD